MASNLTDQVRSISEVTKAVASGDLTKLVDVDVQGEMLDLKETVGYFPSSYFTRHVKLFSFRSTLWSHSSVLWQRKSAE